MQYGDDASKKTNLSFNVWDIIAFVIVLAVILLFAWGATQMTSPFALGEEIHISLSPWHLPNYALRTVLRMFIAMFFSIGFTFIFGTLAAKNKYAERVIIPFIDIMQSVPILGWLAISTAAFISLFPGSLLGPECAAIFAIFTSQVWNMALSFYQSITTVPKEYKQAAKVFRLTAWARFWRIEVPFAMPGLIWNAMISMSAGWFFVVASEAIAVANHKFALPGIGSYISLAIEQANMHGIFYAIIAMFVVILSYDQLIFRPFLTYAQRFNNQTDNEEEERESWVLDLFNQTTMLRRFSTILKASARYILEFNLPAFIKRKPLPRKMQNVFSFTLITSWHLIIFLGIAACIFLLAKFIHKNISSHEIMHVFYLGLISAIKVMVLIVLASIVWIPVGTYLGLRPKLANFFMPLTQFIAAFPMNLVYPIVVLVIIKYNLNVDIWTSPLMILGTQWYILFNVIAGANAINSDLIMAGKNYRVKKWLWWKRIALPGIFPYYITGAMAAAGGCWNASIVADVVSWGDTTLKATGLGGYITEYTTIGDYPRIALGIGVMCLYVTIINRLLWHKLYILSQEHFNS